MRSSNSNVALCCPYFLQRYYFVHRYPARIAQESTDFFKFVPCTSPTNRSTLLLVKKLLHHFSNAFGRLFVTFFGDPGVVVKPNNRVVSTIITSMLADNYDGFDYHIMVMILPQVIAGDDFKKEASNSHLKMEHRSICPYEARQAQRWLYRHSIAVMIRPSWIGKQLASIHLPIRRLARNDYRY